MKISAIRAQTKCDKLRIWHKKFIFFPRRIGDEYQFLCYVARKYYSDFDYYFFSRLGEYSYKDLQQLITDKLMDK